MTEVIELFFNGRKETLEIINIGGDIIRHLSKIDTKVCPLIGSEIKLTGKLGKGAFGEVFSIEMPGQPEKTYAAKRNVSPMSIMTFRPGKTYIESFKGWFKNEGHSHVDIDDFFEFNNVKDPKGSPADNQTMYYPAFMIDTCSSHKTFERSDSKGDVIVPKNSLLCKSSLTELIISLLIGELAREGNTINFIDTFYFATCRPAKTIVYQYTFMEKIDTSLGNLAKNKTPGELTDEDIVSIYLQIVHALGVIQNKYAIVHGDLHLDNVFVQKASEEFLKKASYFEFALGENSIYIRSGYVKWIAKIGDWGLSVKYPTKNSPNIIGNSEVFESGFNQYDGNGPWLPNFYTKAYDIAYFTARMHAQFPGNVFIRRIVMWMLGYDPDRVPNNETLDFFRKIFRPATGYRPYIAGDVLSTTLAHVSPEALLSNPSLMGKFLQKPNDSILKVSSLDESVEIVDINDRKERFDKQKIKKYTAERKGYIDRIQSPVSGVTISIRNQTVQFMAYIMSNIKHSGNKDFIASVAILDYYLSHVKTNKNMLQSIACACMYLSLDAKGKLATDAIFDDLVIDYDFTIQKQTRQKIINLFNENNQDFTELPNTAEFLEEYQNKGLLTSSKNRQNIAVYTLYIAAANEVMLKYEANMIATCAILIAEFSAVDRRVDLFKDVEGVTGFTMAELKPCIEQLREIYKNISVKSEIYMIFNTSKHSSVSTLKYDGVISDLLNEM